MKRYIDASAKYNMKSYEDLSKFLNTANENCDKLFMFMEDHQDDSTVNSMYSYVGQIQSNIQLAQIRLSQL